MDFSYTLYLLYLVLICQITESSHWVPSQYIWHLCQARINWEVCGSKSIGHKNGGRGTWVAPSRIVGVCLCYLPLHHKVQKKIPSGIGSPG